MARPLLLLLGRQTQSATVLMKNNILKSKVTRLFRVWPTTELSTEKDTDEYGFLNPSPSLFGFEHLLLKKATLVLAPPFLGKTFVLESIYKYLSHSSEQGNTSYKFGEFICLTQLESYSQLSKPLPDWWSEWIKSSKKACWIIDALDEGDHRVVGLSDYFLSELKKLKNARDRLILIISSREAELPLKFLDSLRKIYGDDFVTVELAPLDRVNAGQIVDKKSFQNALTIIKRFKLQSIAGYPAVVKYLSGRSFLEPIIEIGVWKEVLKDFLHEKSPARTDHKSEIEHRFDAATRIAAAMSFSGSNYLSDDQSSTGITLADIIPIDARDSEKMRIAARDALKSEMFRWHFDGYRFSQKNIREWMTAFKLSDFSLNRFKPLITDDEGSINDKFIGIIDIVERITKDDAVKEWINNKFGGIVPVSDAVPLTLSDVINKIDRLENLADSSKWNIRLWEEKGLKKLELPGLRSELCKRIADKKRTLRVRELLVEIATAVRAAEVVPIAIKILLDSSECNSLKRSLAILICNLATDDQLMSLENYIIGAKGNTRIERKIRADLIKALLDKKLWSVIEALKYAPELEKDVVDTSSLLIFKLEKLMTLNDARQFIKVSWKGILEYVKKYLETDVLRRDSKNQIYNRAISLFSEQEEPCETDQKKIIEIALVATNTFLYLGFNNKFTAALYKFKNSRRELYIRDYWLSCKKTKKIQHRIWRNMLHPDDIDWLHETIKNEGINDESVFIDLLSLAHAADIQRSKKLEVRKYFRENIPEILDKFDKERQRLRCWEHKHKRNQEKREKEQQRTNYTIEQIVQHTINRENFSEKEKMLQLSWICFSEESSRPNNVTGKWRDLPLKLQTAVIEFCAKALEKCKPTEIPEGNTFSSSILYEAQCFHWILLTKSEKFLLNGKQISRWLPAVLKGIIPYQDEIIDMCHTADTEATEKILLKAIESETRARQNYVSLIQNLPEKYWTNSFSYAISKLINRIDIAEETRSSVLHGFVKGAPQDAQTLIKDLILLKHDNNIQSLLWCTAIDAFLVIDPVQAWPIVKGEFSKAGKAILVKLKSLHSHFDKFNAKPLSWPINLRLDLARTLFEAFPPLEDPKTESGKAFTVTPEYELRVLRGQVQQSFHEQGTKEAIEALEQLADEQQSVKDWYAHIKAQTAAKDVLDSDWKSKDQLLSKKEYPPISEVVKFLENKQYRLIRTDDDLLAVIIEELEKIRKDSADYLPMLYKPEENTDGPKRRHEEALQSYISCRLKDRLEDKILERETQVVYQRRLDIKIIAPKINRDYATVVIEVKWSNNPEISTSLKEQLGKKYLLDANYKHGIYLVGWNGILRWRKQASPRPVKKELPQSLLKKLEEQAEAFKQLHQDIVIRPIVFDLVWVAN